MLVDVHCHLTEYKKDLEMVLAGIDEKMDLVVTSGITPRDNLDSLLISERSQKIKVAFGLNPVSLGRDPSLFESYLRVLYDSEEKVSGIGEVGLDYHWEKSEKGRENQRNFFSRFIDLARDLGLPLVVHTRSAMADTLAILERNTPEKFFIHSFTGSPSQARRVIDLGGFISISTASVRFKDHYAKLINSIPLEYILTETDSPYLAPRKGEKNYPWNVKETLGLISELKDQDFDLVARQIWRNTLEIFGD